MCSCWASFRNVVRDVPGHNCLCMYLYFASQTAAAPPVGGGAFNAGVDGGEPTNDKVKPNVGAANAPNAGSGSSIRYVPGLPCAQQNLFLSSLLGALR